jgi:drug/metabolite transporter (DMT)-like permease
LSPFQYVQLVWATLLGWLVFDQLPDKLSLAGGLVIVASGLAIALDERRSAAPARSPGRTAARP